MEGTFQTGSLRPTHASVHQDTHLPVYESGINPFPNHMLLHHLFLIYFSDTQKPLYLTQNCTWDYPSLRLGPTKLSWGLLYKVAPGLGSLVKKSYWKPCMYIYMNFLLYHDFTAVLQTWKQTKIDKIWVKDSKLEQVSACLYILEREIIYLVYSFWFLTPKGQVTGISGLPFSTLILKFALGLMGQRDSSVTPQFIRATLSTPVTVTISGGEVLVLPHLIPCPKFHGQWLQPLNLSGILNPVIVQPRIGGHHLDQPYHDDSERDDEDSVDTSYHLSGS